MALDDVDPEHPAVRRELIERGLAIAEETRQQVHALLGIDHPETVHTVLLDPYTLTVIRKHITRRVIPGPGLNGRGEVQEFERVTRHRTPIIGNPEETP